MKQLKAALLGVCLAACASHSDRTRAIRSALDAGEPRVALSELNAALSVSSERDLPQNTAGDNALLLLDRAMVLQQLDQYSLSSRDLETADKEIQLLDFSRGAVDDIGKYIFSDNTGPYMAPAYEKLLINSENILNYLARRDLNGARIEARRLSVMQKYFAEHDDPSRALLAAGSYLAGFTFEKSGRADDALRYYDDALAHGDYASLARPVRQLLADGSYSSPRLKEAAERAPDSASNNDAEILVVIEYGRVPAKIARRLPIGLALTYAAGGISPEQSAQANQLAAQGLVTWVNYPELGRPQGAYVMPSVKLDGQGATLEAGSDVAQEAYRAWDAAKGTLIASAITRVVSRVVAGEAARHVTNDQLVGTLLSLGVQATLTVADTPDTRSWQTLPAKIVFGRFAVKHGDHTLELVTRSSSKLARVHVDAGGYAVVTHTVLN